MLGGYSVVHGPDVRDSKRFLQAHLGAACQRNLVLGKRVEVSQLV